MLNGFIAYDGHGPIESLEHDKLCRGYRYIEPMVIWFNPYNTFDLNVFNDVNISLVSEAILFIQSDQDYRSDLHVVGLSLQMIRIGHGTFNIVV